ncbi:MAG: DNA glycosylase AlkZ-like family protein [Saccharofermentanales bacterium]|nr:hypothetical protein [Bacillota bacterium]
MEISNRQIINYRLKTHHLDQRLPLTELVTAVSACGVQNSPPGSWETAMFNRLEDCTEQALSAALTESKTLLQAWSFRGAPIVFPSHESSIFLTALIPQGSERPWIYTQGMTGILDLLDLPFEDLLRRQVEAIGYLDDNVVKNKNNLERLLADLIYPDLPPDRQKIWLEPSGFNKLVRKTVGQTAVSFLLRPCSYMSLVVFGARTGVNPTFTSFRN